MKKIIITFFLMILMTSCGKLKKNNVSSDRKIIEDKQNQDANSLKTKSNEIKTLSYIEHLSEKKLPLKDSTNFDSFRRNQILSKKEIRELKLDTKFKNITNFQLRYKVNLSDHFKSVVLTYERGEMELLTYLINYDENFKIIDVLNIAYDEIAESVISTRSTINKNKITVENINWANEKPEIETSIYIIKSNGKFEIKK